ncbi:MAG TPA: PQQ-dependent sugar dehydrogenase [Gemmatimonadaceae bacterium]|nr:PQQ-dependent sugar dehydrogenase [Gemmatimonadaceae bacterium]
MRTKPFTSLALLLILVPACRDEIRVLEPDAAPRLLSAVGDPFTVGLRQVAGGLTAPVAMVSARDGTGRLFIADQAGVVRVLGPDGTLSPVPFLDVRSRMVALRPNFDERGLLGLAFHPDYRSNGRFFVYYSAPLRPGGPAGFDHTSHIAEYRVSADPDLADPASERIILQVDEPQFNHNAGAVVFGPDRYLYIALGDGGGAHDTGLGHVDDWYEANDGGNGQDIEQNLLGSILRIDVDGGMPYGIPADNPFVGRTGRDETWAYGFRNPFRMSFDRGGEHGLLVGDVGQFLIEEVNVVERGGNYGWNVREGTLCFDTSNPNVPRESCPSQDPDGVPLLPPVVEYLNARQPGGLGISVIGGFVYRGSALPQFRGRYIFGDWSRGFVTPDGTLFVASPRRSGPWQIQELMVQGEPNGRLGRYVIGFGEDDAGEVYVLTSRSTGPTGATGAIFQIVRPGQGRR